VSTVVEQPAVTREGVQALIDEIDEWLDFVSKMSPDDTARINKFLDQRLEYMKVRDML
jgi:putative protein kinase ArgK-like GTPase of G3E family